MSRSFGGGRPDPQEDPDKGREGAQPRGNAPQSRASMRPNLRSGQSQSQAPATRSAGYSTESAADEPQGEIGDEMAANIANTVLGKRLVAFLVDVLVGYILTLVVNCIPLVNTFLHDQIILIGYLLVKDHLFGGRGVGKNLMGLQVVGSYSGVPASIIQSIKRNIVIYGPYLLLYAGNLVIFIPDINIRSIIQNVLNGIGGIYTIIVLPYEAYRVYSSKDGRRWGDDFAGTTTVAADMDFSNPGNR